MIQRHFLFFVTTFSLFFSSATFGSIEAINTSPSTTWKHSKAKTSEMRHNAFVSNIDNKAIFMLSFPEQKCHSNSLNIHLFYKVSPKENQEEIFKEGFHMTAFRQFYNLKTVNVHKEGDYIKATLKPTYSETINLLDSLEKGNKMSLIWKGENHSLKPLEFNLTNSGNSIQKMYTLCMNETYEAKRHNDK